MSVYLAPSAIARRTFLRLTAAAVALVPLVQCLAGGARQFGDPSPASPDAGDRRLTPHIQSYYHSTRALYP
jgi:hypothetical protein